MLPNVQMTDRLVGQDGADQVHIVDLAGTCVDSLEELIHLVIAHLFAEIREDVSQLPNADEAGHVLVEDLETAAVFFRLARVSEATRSVQDLAE